MTNDKRLDGWRQELFDLYYGEINFAESDKDPEDVFFDKLTWFIESLLEAPQKWIPYKAVDKVEDDYYLVTCSDGCVYSARYSCNQWSWDDSEPSEIDGVVAYCSYPTPYNEKGG